MFDASEIPEDMLKELDKCLSRYKNYSIVDYEVMPCTAIVIRKIYYKADNDFYRGVLTKKINTTSGNSWYDNAIMPVFLMRRLIEYE